MLLPAGLDANLGMFRTNLNESKKRHPEAGLANMKEPFHLSEKGIIKNIVS